MDKPKVYHDVRKIIHNNMEVCLGNKENTFVKDKIKELINKRDFNYFKEIKIRIDNDFITKKIIGIKNDNLITVDREIIPIDKIKEIK